LVYTDKVLKFVVKKGNRHERSWRGHSWRGRNNWHEWNNWHERNNWRECNEYKSIV